MRAPDRANFRRGPGDFAYRPKHESGCDGSFTARIRLATSSETRQVRYPPNLLIEDFSVFYQGRIAVFKRASHVIDMEPSIEKQFLQTPLTSKGNPVTHYRFADSKAEPGIQLADVVVGTLGKMHSDFTGTPSDEVATDRANLTGTALQNAKLLRDLIGASHQANIAFLHHVSSMHLREKADLFLRFKDGAYSG